MIRRIAGRFRSLANRRRLDADIQKEINHHVTMETERRMRAGMSADEARRTALRDFGGVGRTREQVRDARGMTFWDTLAQDARFGWRTLRRSPGYTVAAMLTLGLGIGANTAMFSVINGVLLKPLPFRDGGDLVIVRQAVPASNVANAGVSIFELYDYRKRLEKVRDLVEYHSMSFTLLNQGDPDRVNTGVVSANFFDMLGVAPEVGRTFRQGEDALGAEPVLVLSHEYWINKFGGDRNVVGRVLQMNNKQHTVIGVLPDYPQYPAKNDVYMPTSACPFRAGAEASPATSGGHRAFAGLSVFGRLAPGATSDQASAEINGVAGTFEKDFAADYQGATGLTGAALPLKDQLVTGARSLLLALTGATLLVLVIACANVANLAVARTMRRDRELALRTALGAGRRRLMRQLVTESVMVALAGGVLGLGLAFLSRDMLVNFVSRFTTRTGQISIDGAVLSFTLLASVLTGVVFGMAPALAARRNLAQSMRDSGTQGGDAPARRRLRAGLVVAQVTVSFVLLVGAALMLQSFSRLSSVPLGYKTDHVMSAAIFGNFTRVNAQNAAAVQAAILERLRSSPGVRSAAITNAVPQRATAPTPGQIQIKGRAADASRKLVANVNAASDGYFETLGIPVLAGREFRVSDTATAPHVVVINQSMTKYWDGADPLGAEIVVPNVPPALNPFTVVGVVADFHLYSVDADIAPQLYVLPAQTGGGGRLLVRTDGELARMGPVVRDAVHAIDAQIPVTEIQTLDDVREARLTTPKLTAALLTLFAGIALVITLAGIAGLIGTSVSQRTREFGLRMALGASRASVLRLVLGQGLLLVVVGLVLGIGGAYAFSYLIADYLFHTPPTDIGAYAGVALTFIAATLIATFAPARRATTIDPLKALKAD